MSVFECCVNKNTLKYVEVQMGVGLKEGKVVHYELPHQGDSLYILLQ